MENIRKALNKTSQVMQKFAQAGLTEELINQIINSPGNQMAQMMMAPVLDTPSGIKTLDFFNTANNQYQTDCFIQVLAKANPQLRVVDPKNLKTIITNGKQKCFDLRKQIGEKNLAQSETEALEILTSTMTDNHKDGKANIVYYLDATGELCYVFCYWFVDGWFCRALRASSVSWRAGFRVFYAATES